MDDGASLLASRVMCWSFPGCTLVLVDRDREVGYENSPTDILVHKAWH